MEKLNADNLLICACVIVVLLTVYNTVMTAMKNHRDEQKRKSTPTLTLEEKLKTHESMLASDKRRIERLEADVKDVKDGQKYLVRGVQSLIDHELHNGNSAQMQSASDDITLWLTNKI